MSECKLILYKDPNFAGESEEFTGDRGVTYNDHANSYKTTGDCSNTAWGVFKDNNGDNKGTGVIIGKGDASGGNFDGNHHGEGKSSLNHRFYKFNDAISFVKKIEIPTLPAGAITEDLEVYGRRADGRQGEWGHYPFVDSVDLVNPNHSQQLLVHTPEIKGSPCPGAMAGVPIGNRTYRCVYTNSNQIQGLYSGLSTNPSDPRRDMYGRVVSKFCEDNENISVGVGGGLTCEDMGASRETWCSQGERIKTDPTCTEAIVGEDAYHRIASAYCQANPGDEWCICYNLSQGVCLNDMGAAGCKHAYGVLDENKDALGPAVEISRAKQDVENGVEGAEAELARLEAQSGYQILKDNVHCRPDACERGYKPRNVKGSCAASYSICDEDMDIRNLQNQEIVVRCNTGIPFKLPSWWNDPIEYTRARKPPYDRFPLNKTPMTHWPKEFRWRSKNVKYHVYSAGGISTISCLCCILLLLIMRMSGKGGRRR